MARGEWRRELLHLAALSGLAIAHPVLEIVGGSPSYFTALRAGRIEASVLLLTIMVVPPLVLTAAVALVGRWSPGARRNALHALVALLVAAITVPPLHRAGLEHPWTVAPVVGLGAAVLYRRARAARDLVTFLALALVAVPAAFLTSLAGEELYGGGGLLRPKVEVRFRPIDRIERPYPIVMLVFDEFPVGLLLGGDGAINAKRYPGFAELARLSTWYRDATSASEITDFAIPAMLTGRAVHRLGSASAGLYPDNLFVLLSRHYRSEVTEYWTKLQPSFDRKREEAPVDRLANVALVLRDASALVARLLVPPSRADDRPAIVELPSPWLNAYLEAPVFFDRFLAGLEPGEGPTIHYCHLMVPHTPQQRLPSGQRYTAALENLAELKQPPDDEQAARQLQREALQLGYADKLVARLLDRLRESGLLDRAVLVVAGDHGIAFQRGALHRVTTAATLDEIAPVPFFVRAPGQRGGRVVDAPVSMVDLLPTIARILGAELPAPVDGQVADEVPDAPRRRSLTDENARSVRIEERGLVRRAARRHAALIGDGDWQDVWRIGPLPELVFQDVAKLPVAGRSEAHVRWSASGDLRSVDPAAELVPALIRAELRPATDALLVAVLNGKVAATATFRRDWPRVEQLLLPPALLRAGRNDLVFLLREAGASTYLGVDGEEAP